jgi:hypothetical protein
MQGGNSPSDVDILDRDLVHSHVAQEGRIFLHARRHGSFRIVVYEQEDPA